MKDLYLNGKHINKDEPRYISMGGEKKLIYPFCKGRPCKELLEKGEEALIEEAKVRNDKMSAGRTI